MDIAQYISDLLNEYNEVSLPGIGAFFKRSVSAYYNEEEGLYFPPSYKIDFKSEQGSDSLLINHIVSTKHISESSAVYFIERFSENIKTTLEKNANASIDPLGTLVTTDTGYSLQSNTENAGHDYFGLTPVKEPEITERAHSPVYSSEDDTAPLTERSSSGSKGILIALAILLLLASITGLAYYFYPQYFKNLNFGGGNKPTKKTTAPVLKTEPSKDSEAFADSVLKNLEEQGIHGAQVEKAPDSVNISTEVTTPDSLNTKVEPQKVYEVIVASFGLKREAETSVRNLRRNGIDAKVVVDVRKPKFKVSIGTFTTMSAANKEKKRIQQGVHKDAWILKPN